MTKSALLASGGDVSPGIASLISSVSRKRRASGNDAAGNDVGVSAQSPCQCSTSSSSFSDGDLEGACNHTSDGIQINCIGTEGHMTAGGTSTSTLVQPLLKRSRRDEIGVCNSLPPTSNGRLNDSPKGILRQHRPSPLSELSTDKEQFDALHNYHAGSPAMGSSPAMELGYDQCFAPSDFGEIASSPLLPQEGGLDASQAMQLPSICGHSQCTGNSCHAHSDACSMQVSGTLSPWHNAHNKHGDNVHSDIGKREAAQRFPHNWDVCPKCYGSNWEFLQDECEHTGVALADEDGIVRCHIVKVDADESAAEWAEVAKGILDAGFLPQNIYRIQNTSTLGKFSRKQEEEASKPWVTEERIGYHVTRAENLKDLLNEGLDPRLSSRGRFGRGLYFAEDPRKSNYYWKGSQDPGAMRMMLRTRILLGRIKEYPPGEVDPFLRREPRGFDSVQGEIGGQKEYVVYDENRAMIEYVITYKIPPTDCFGLPVTQLPPVAVPLSSLVATLPPILPKPPTTQSSSSSSSPQNN